MVKKKISRFGLLSSQAKVWEQLKKIAVSQRLGSAYLFHGPSGSGKEYIATKFAQMLNCEKQIGSICRNCPSCKRSEILQHENINLVFPLPLMKKKSVESMNEFEKSNVDVITDNIKKKGQ